jgi:hypothetical protein
LQLQDQTTMFERRSLLATTPNALAYSSCPSSSVCTIPIQFTRKVRRNKYAHAQAQRGNDDKSIPQNRSAATHAGQLVLSVQMSYMNPILRKWIYSYSCCHCPRLRT